MEWTLANIIRTHARDRGDYPMITYGERTIPYAEMHERSSRVAQGLLAEGVGPQDHVAFLDKNSPEYFEVLFGGGKVNAINVAVNWRLAPREMAYIINDAEARVLFVGPDFVSHLDAIEDSLQTVRKLVVLGDHSRHESYEAWLRRYPAKDPARPSAPDDVAMQLYTSGTTGLPKGAMLTNTNLGAQAPQVAPRWGIDASSVNAVAMPLFHIGGSGWALVGMWRGCHSLLFRDFAPPEVLAALQRYRVTNALFVPAMLQILAQLPGATDSDYTREQAAERRRFIREQTGADLHHVGQYSFDPSILPGNIEHFIGVAQVPIGLAGPLLVNGEHAQGEFYVPLATTEGTLVASSIGA